MKEEAKEKRLLRYLLTVKRPIIIGLLCLVIAVALELVGPFIAKTIIDEHILGVEGHWYELKEADDSAVQFEEKYFQRGDRLQGEKVNPSPITILQVARHYYMIEEEVILTGKREVEHGHIKVTVGDQEQTYLAEKLSIAQIYPFFKPEQKPIIYLIILYLVLIVIAGIFLYFQTLLLQRSSNEMIKRMRQDIYLHTQRIPIDYYVHTPAGSIVSRITNDTEAIRDLFERVLSIVVTSAIYMVGIFFALFILDAKLATLCLFVIPLIFGWMKLYKHFGTKYNTVIRETISKINGHISEIISGMPIIQAFRQEKNVKREFELLNENLLQYERKLTRLSALTSYNLVSFLRNLTFVGFIWYFGSASLQAESMLSIGLLYAFVDYITRLFEPVINIVNQLPLVEQARVASRRVFSFMDLDAEAVDHRSLERYQGAITFKDVSFAYDGKHNVLKNISFSIQTGETVAFVGHTGSGKSTIMNLILRFYDPQKGKIFIDDKRIDEWSRQQVRQHMGIVLQDPFIFSGTILSNVTMNDPNISEEVAIDALQAVGGHHLVEKLPQGYKTKITEGGRTFSLGERQLISFARALAFDPAILILDEATANIDTETESFVQQGLKVLQEGRTTIIIAHRLSTIQEADQIIVLDKGVIKEKGTHQSLMLKKGLYAEMYQMQQGRLKITEQLS